MKAWGGRWFPVRALWLGCAILPVIVSGCAQVQVTRLAKDTDYKDGVRFYRPRPYLWVTVAKEEATGDLLKATIIWLPDYSQEYVATWRTGLGAVNAQLTLQDGWNLIGLTGQADSKTADIITAMSGLVPSIAGKRFDKEGYKQGKQKDEDLPLGLWKIDIERDGKLKLSRAW
jgi:hypothetical protein